MTSPGATPKTKGGKGGVRRIRRPLLTGRSAKLSQTGGLAKPPDTCRNGAGRLCRQVQAPSLAASTVVAALRHKDPR